MSKPRPANSSSVSLFPFLAVLVCAMGALIFLLIVTTRRIRIQAVARAAAIRVEQESATTADVPPPEEPEPPPEILAVVPELPPEPEPKAVIIDPPRLPDPDDEVKARLAALVDQRDERERLYNSQQELAAKQRDKRTKMTSQIDKSAAALNRLTAKRRDSQRAATAIVAVKTSMDDQIKKSLQQIRQVRAEQAEADSKYAFVPYDGKSGTTLRPILIECTNKSIRFVPEDIKLTPADLNGFTQSYNPVLAGARALVQHWYEWNLNQPQPSAESEPYILLLVRPNGSLSFYIARKLLARLGRPFGYELIEDDFPLALPDPDPDAVKACQAAIDRALSQRAELLAEIARGNSLRSAGQLRLQRGTGEFQFEDDPIGRAGRGANSSSTNPDGSTKAGTVRPVPAPLPRRPGPLGGGATASQRFFGSNEFSRRATGTGDGNGIRGDAENVNGNGNNGQSDRGVGPSTTRDSSQTGNGRNDKAASRVPNPMDRIGQGNPNGKRNKAAGVGSEMANQQGVESGKTGTVATPRPHKSPTDAARPSGGNSTGDSASNSAAPGGPGQQIPSFAPLSLGNSRSRNQRGSQSRRWGHFNPRAGIGLERRLTVYVQADRVAIGRSIVRSDGDTLPEQFVAQVIHAIDQNARAWGNPPRNFYWVPMIKFRVSPGGNIHYERLRRELNKVGLSVAVDHTLGTPQANEGPVIQP